MKIRFRFHLNIFLTLGFFLLFLILSLYFFTSSKEKITHLKILEDIEESLFELEVNIGEHARSVLHYTRFPDEPTLSKIEDSQLDLERYLRAFLNNTAGNIPQESVDKIRRIDEEHRTIGNALMSVIRQRNKVLALFRTKVRAIDELIDEEFQVVINHSDPDVFVKLEAALDIEINVDEAFAAVEGYALAFDPEFKLLIEDAKADFAHFLELYRSTPNTIIEKRMLNSIEKKFQAALEDGSRIIVLTDDLNSLFISFEQLLSNIDHVLDDEIQLFIHQKIRNESGELEDLFWASSITLITSALLLFMLIGGINFFTSRRIITSLAQLSEGSRQFGKGNLSFQINTTKNMDELDTLANDLKNMAHELEVATISRDELVAEIVVRKQVESELESSRTRFAGILEIAQDAIISINESQHITIFNKGAEATFGYVEEEILGKPLDILIPEKFHKAHRAHVDSFIESEVDTNQMGPHLNLSGRHKNGSTFPIEATISKLLSKGTTVLTVILRDISIRKNIEEQLQDHNILLEQAVEQKTMEMQGLSERLVRQEKLATVGQISANIAHELRNPLGAIKQVVYYLGRLIEKGKIDRFDEKINDSLELINSELDIASTVITNLLDATQARTLSPALVDLEKLTHEAVNSSRLLRMLDIQFQLEQNPFFIFVDADQFRQVIINLLTNVSQTGKQGVQVTICARVLLDINQTLIQIEDNGPGIEVEVIDKVFEPLFTTREMGTGLGLSICKQIIENHCGTIVLSNKKAQGTVVEIQLPMNKLNE